MRTGIRRVRQHLSALLKEIRRGHEIEITDRGELVARLVPPGRKQSHPYKSRAGIRKLMPKLDSPLSQAVLDEREDRL